MNIRSLSQWLNSVAKRSRPFCRWVLIAAATLAGPLALPAQSGRASAPYIWRYGYDPILANTDLVYAEVRVETSVAGSYYCAIGGDGFYFGLQEGGASYNKHVHFSVWDPTSDIAWKASDVVAVRFGGEGTGWATYWPFDWQTNADYRLCVRITPQGTNTLYHAYFFDPAVGAWKHLVAIPRHVAGGAVTFFYSFNEDFGARYWLARSYLVGNEWARTRAGQWIDLTNGLFTVAYGDDTNAFDADVVGRWFRLETGGDTVRDTPVDTVVARAPGVQPTDLPDESNHVPVAADLSFTVLENRTYRAAVSATDEDGDSLAFRLAQAPAHGTAAVQADGTFTYTPGAGYTGTDAFQFAVDDGQGASATGRVSVTVAPVVVPTPKASVARTGQSVCYRAGDDGDLRCGVGWAQPRFTDNGDGTVTDNNTGLIWLKNANPCGSQTWSAAIDYANALGSGSAGLTDGSQPGDWRLPNQKELLSLLDFGNHDPILPAGHPFSGVVSSYYWVSTTMTGAENALGLSLANGHHITWGKEVNAWYVWPVRGVSTEAWRTPVEKSGVTNSFRTGDDGFHQQGQAWASPRFADNSDGTFTDLNTGLIWLKNASPCGATNWNDAVDYTRNLSNGVAGLSDASRAGDWRLPNLREMLSFFDLGRQPVLPAGHPLVNLASSYWVSTTSPADPANAYWVGTYDVNLYTAVKTESHSVWAVREPTETTLRAERLGNRMLLAWPTVPGGFFLQSRPSLSPADVWSWLSQTVTISNNQCWVSVDCTGAQAFFRLAHPLGDAFALRAYDDTGCLCSIGWLDITFSTVPISGTWVLRPGPDCGACLREGAGRLEGQNTAAGFDLDLTPGVLGRSLWLRGRGSESGFAGIWQDVIITYPPYSVTGTFVAERIQCSP